MTKTHARGRVSIFRHSAFRLTPDISVTRLCRLIFGAGYTRELSREQNAVAPSTRLTTILHPLGVHIGSS